MEKLSQDTIDTHLEELAEWSQANDKIQRTFAFEDFEESMTFVNNAAQHAESIAHHPDILIRFNKVTLTLSTHDAGGLTEKDIEFARHADSLAPEKVKAAE